MSSLDGLLAPSRDDQAVRSLHPLVRDYCITRFAVEAPERKRRLHARIARALARRGQLTPAWRHARSAGDSPFAGALIESVGVAGLWARGGTPQVLAADRFLTPDVMEARPRLALLHCVALGLASKGDEAAALYEAVARTTAGFTRDRHGGDTDALSFDGLFTQFALARDASRMPRAQLDAQPRAPAATPADDAAARLQAAVRHTLLCCAAHERARFEESRAHGKRAQTLFGSGARYGDIYVSICLGMAAMAEGRVREATDHYRRGRQGARRFFPSDPLLAATAEIVTIELDLERNRERAIQQRTLPALAELQGGWTDIYAAAADVSAELTFEQHGGDAAVALLRTAIDARRSTGAGGVSHHLSALLAEYLVLAGRGGEAAALWRDRTLPDAAAELLDVERQSWRTMEALSRARVLLLLDQGNVEAAGELAAALCRAASTHGLTRTVLRGLALSMAAAQQGPARRTWPSSGWPATSAAHATRTTSDRSYDTAA